MKEELVIGLLVVNVALTVLIPFHALVFTFPARTYDAKRATAEIAKAESVNNLEDVARYVDNALEYLKPYSGNPCWWYPTAQTDWGRIKENLQSLSNSAKTLEAKPDTFAYQQMLHNLEDELLELREQIGETIGWLTIGSTDTLFFILVWAILWIIFLVASFLS